MKKAYLIILLFNFCVMPIFADTIRTDNYLRNLYETQSEIKSVPENVVKTKPKRKLFCKQKKEENIQQEIIMPVEKDGFVIFTQN